MSAYRLSVTVADARDLISADSNGLSDPYCTVICGTERKSTQIRHKTLQPTWNEIFTFKYVSDGTEIRFEVYDQDVPKFAGSFGFAKKIGRKHMDDPLGHCKYRVDLAEIAKNGGSLDLRMNLLDVKSGELHVQIHVENSPTGTENAQALVSAAAASTSDPSFEHTAATQAVSGDGGSSVVVPFVVGPASFLPTLPSTETDIYVALPEGVPLVKRMFSSLPQDGTNDPFYREKVFVAGEDVSVTLFIQVQEPQIVVRSVLVRFLGRFLDASGNKLGKKICESFGSLFKEKKVLVRGKHGFTFSFKLPAACPSSVAIRGGAVARYVLSVDVDVVNREDEHFAREIAVVNRAHTPLAAPASQPRQQNVRKSCRHLKGRRGPDTGDVDFAISLLSDNLQPLHDIEVDATITSEMKMTTLKDLIVVLEATIKVPGAPHAKAAVFRHNLQLAPKLRGAGTHKQKFIFELPASIGHSFTFREFSVSYELSFTLDVPGSDLKLRFPINVLLPDPTVQDALFSLSPEAEVARLPQKFEALSARQVRTWFMYVAGKNDALVAQAFGGLCLHDASGAEITSLFHELANPDYGIAALCAGATDPAVHAAVRRAIELQVMPWEHLRRVLTRAGLAHTYETFVLHKVSWEELPRVTQKDMVRHMKLKVGEALRILDLVPNSPA